MQATQNNIAGSAVFWTLGEETRFADFANALKAAGFGGFTPERQSDYAALRNTLERRFPGCEIFPVKHEAFDTFEVVTVRRGEATGRNTYDHKLTAWCRAGNVVTDTHDAATDASLTEEFRRERERIPYHNVSRALVKIVYHLNGTTLRPSGGIYWIPNASWERWEMIANALEHSGPRNQCFGLRTLLDEHSAAALRQALTDEIEREAAEIDERLHDPASSLRTAATQRSKAQALRRKIETYEAAFEMLLPDLKRQIDQATGREAIATLLESASAGPVLTELDDGAVAERRLEFAFA